MEIIEVYMMIKPHFRTAVPNHCGLTAYLGRKRETGPRKWWASMHMHVHTALAQVQAGTHMHSSTCVNGELVRTCTSAHWPTTCANRAAHVASHSRNPFLNRSWPGSGPQPGTWGLLLQKTQQNQCCLEILGSFHVSHITLDLESRHLRRRCLGIDIKCSLGCMFL